MSNPSFSNIDRWLFELTEGNLSPEQVQQLEIFLLQHPELDVDKDMWELARVDKTEVTFPHQHKFIKRKPVGLFMMAGFVSISLFVWIGAITYSSSDLNLNDQLSAKNHVNGSGSKIASKTDLTAKGNKSTKNSLTREERILIEEANLQFTSNKNYVPTGLSNSAFRGSNSTTTNKTNSFFGENNLIEFENPVYAIENKQLEKTEVLIEDAPTNNTAENQKSLSTYPLEELDVPVSRNWIGANTVANAPKVSSTDYSSSFSSKFNKAARALSRMMDNPVALKNLKDPSFHLPGMLPADVNFGNTGTLPATRVQTLTRLQWPNRENQQLMNQLALDGYIYAIRGGIGVQVNHSYYGEGQIKGSQIAMTYSPKISVNRNILIEPSIRFKMGNKTLDANKITGFGFAEMDRDNVQSFYPSGTTPVGQQLWYRDLGLGMMVNTKWFFAGIQGDNLFRHYDNIYSGEEAASRRVGQHFIATIGTDYESKKELIGLSPYLVYQQREDLKEIWTGVNGRVGWFTMGLAVSDRLDGVASAGLKFNNFAFSYQADYIHSAIWDKQFLSHQLSLKFISFNKNKKQKFLNL
jgi:hypothetical protein